MEHISVQPVRSFVSLKAAAARKKVFVSVGGEGDDDEGREEGRAIILPPSVHRNAHSAWPLGFAARLRDYPCSHRATWCTAPEFTT